MFDIPVKWPLSFRMWRSQLNFNFDFEILFWVRIAPGRHQCKKIYFTISKRQKKKERKKSTYQNNNKPNVTLQDRRAAFVL